MPLLRKLTRSEEPLWKVKFDVVEADNSRRSTLEYLVMATSVAEASRMVEDSFPSLWTDREPKPTIEVKSVARAIEAAGILIPEVIC